MDIEGEVAALEQRVERLVHVVGTRKDFAAADDAREESLPSDWLDEKKTLCDLLLFVRRAREDLMREKKDLAGFDALLRTNRALLDNFTSFANTALNVRDKAKLLLVVRQDLLELKGKLGEVRRVRQALEGLHALQLPVDHRFSAELLLRYREVATRAEEQNSQVTAMLDAYAQIMDALNVRLAQLAQRLPSRS